MKSKLIILSICLGCLWACENRELNEGEKFRPREVHDDFKNSHFTRVTVDGVEYIMMERDNNNPHEGFGFMAFRANSMIERQDTTIAYLKAIYELQVRMYAQSSRRSLESVRSEADTLFNFYLNIESADLQKLESDSLTAE